MAMNVFIDADGTLVAYDGLVPDSAWAACKKARENGHRLVLCTGRSLPEIYDDVLDVGFDAIIAGSGAYIEVGGKPLLHKTFSPDLFGRFKRHCTERGIQFYAEANDGLYPTGEFKQFCIDLFSKAMAKSSAPADSTYMLDRFLATMTYDKLDEVNEGVNKVCVYSNDLAHSQSIEEAFGDELVFTPYNDGFFGAASGEVALPGISKSSAIEVLLQHWGAEVKDSAGIGDGTNDVEMLKFCGKGVALGNAVQELKDVADFVSTDVGADGLAGALAWLEVV